MAPKELPCDWQLECPSARLRGAKLLESEQWADCSFEVGDEGVRVGAHRLLLAAASPVFERMLYGAMAEPPGPVRVPDMEPDAFRAMLEYIYTDNLNLDSCSLACDVYYGALKYMLLHLQELCISFLSTNLDPGGACGAYELAVMTDNSKLMDESVKMMRHRTSEVLEASSFVEAQVETVVMMYSLEPLSVPSELQLLQAAERFARAQGTLEGVVEPVDKLTIAEVSTTDRSSEQPPAETPSSGKLCDPTARDPQPECSVKKAGKVTLRDAVRRIRFLTMEPQELAALGGVSVLSDGEARALAAGLVPPGFSTSTEPRVETCQRVVVPLGRSGFCVYYSPVYRVRNIAWKLHAQRNLLSKTLCVHMEGNWVYDPGRFCAGEFEVTLVSHSEPAARSVAVRPYLPFRKKTCYERGSYDFVSWEDLLDPAFGYIQDDAFTLLVRLIG